MDTTAYDEKEIQEVVNESEQPVIDTENVKLDDTEPEMVEAGEVERPDSENTESKTNTEENSEETTESSEDESKNAIKDEQETIKQLRMFLQLAGNTIHEMESKWRMVSSQLKLTNKIVKELYDYNGAHAVPLPEEATAEAHVQYDHFNGLDNLTQEELVNIFGEDHNLVKGDIKENIKIIKNAMGLFINWLASLKEYKEAHKEYENILDAEQEKNIELLKNLLENTPEDSPDRENIQKALDSYYDKLYLNFLSTPLTIEAVQRLVNVYNNEEKFEYWQTRAAEKLKQIGVIPLTIVELGGFEKNFLEEKYHKYSNMLALYVMNLARYARNDDPSPENMKRKILIITSTIHKMIEGNMPDEQKEKILANIRSFLDQFSEMDVTGHIELFDKLK